MKYFIFLALCIGALLSSCKKDDTTSNNTPPPCGILTAVSATPATFTATQGQKFLYTCSPAFSGSTTSPVTYTWMIPGLPSRTTKSDSIVGIDYIHAGWWFVEAKNTCDNVVKKDSFQLTVVPSCNNTVTDNILSFTGFLTGNANFTGTNLQNGALNFGPGEVYFGIQSNQPSSTGSIVIVFHPQYNLSNLPPTGAYSTSSIAANGRPVFGAGDIGKCYIRYAVYNVATGIVVYASNPNQGVYIMNQNGKLKAVLCDLGLTGTSSLTGLTYHPVATGAIAVP